MKKTVKKRKVYEHCGWTLEETDAGTISLHKDGSHRNFSKLEELKQYSKLITIFITDCEVESKAGAQ